MTCSIIGRPAMVSSGFGVFDVRGRSRLPSPPAMMTAFTGAALRSARPTARFRRISGTYVIAA